MNDTVDFESTPMVESIDDVKPHATFQSIGIFSAFFFVLFVIAMAMFEIAVHLELNRLFAPRSYARPKEVRAYNYFLLKATEVAQLVINEANATYIFVFIYIFFLNRSLRIS